MTSPEACALAALVAEVGVPVPFARNLPPDMGDPSSAWFVDEGAVDLFLLEHQAGVEISAPQHLLRAERGHLLPGVAPHTEHTTLSLIAKGLPGTVLRRLPVTRLAEIDDGELGAHVDAWFADVSAMLMRDVIDSPRTVSPIETCEAPAGGSGTIAARRGVVWVSLAKGARMFLDLFHVAGSELGGETATVAIPLTPATWLTLAEALLLTSQTSEDLAKQGTLLTALANFHAVALALKRINRRLAVVDQANLARYMR